MTAGQVSPPDRPLQLPSGASFTRDSNGAVVMRWPNLGVEGGLNFQVLDSWISENCPPGTTYDLIETSSLETSECPQILGVRLECERTMKYDDPVFAEFDPAIPPAAPRLFHLVRYDDPSGVSGTGIVAQGMEARDGAVALRWCVPGMPATWNLFDSIADVELLNGHNGRTVVKWIDEGKPSCA